MEMDGDYDVVMVLVVLLLMCVCKRIAAVDCIYVFSECDANKIQLFV